MNVGIVVVTTSERRHLFDLADQIKDLSAKPWQNHRLKFGRREALVVTSGIGLINAAGAAEWLIERYQSEIVLNFGCAGSHRRDLMPGDVVIANRFVNHSQIQVLPDGSERYSGFINEQDGDQTFGSEITSDPRLVAIAEAVAADKSPPDWPVNLLWPASVPHRSPAVVTGAIASADIWTQSPAKLDAIHATHGSLCEEMEAVAIGRICQLHRVPFLAIKDISNNEYYRSSDIESFEDFPVAEVGKRAAFVLAGLIQRLPDEI